MSYAHVGLFAVSAWSSPVDQWWGRIFLDIAPTPGPPLLLPGHRHNAVSSSPCSFQPLHLQGKQWAITAELLKYGRRSGIKRSLEYLLSAIEPRRGPGIRELRD